MGGQGSERSEGERHTGPWSEAQFLAEATDAGAAMLEGVKKVVARHPTVFALGAGERDTMGSMGVDLLRRRKGRVYSIYTDGDVAVDFTRLEAGDIQKGLRERLAPVDQRKALRGQWPRFPGHEPWQRKALLDALDWLGEAFEVRPQ